MNERETTVIGSQPAPPGVTPNFQHPHDVFYTVNLVVQILCIAVTTLCVFLRLYIRARIVGMFGIEDWCCSIAWVFATYFFASGIVLGEEGGGYHDWELTKPAFMRFKKTLWNPAIRKSCINTTLVFRIDNILSVLTDLLILILPIPLMWSVQMTRKKKIGIGMLLGAGGLATTCSAARLIITSVQDIPDATLGATQFKMLAVAELAIALSCACAPSFNVLYSRLSETSKAKRSAYTSSVKMSTFGHSAKGSRGIKGRPVATYMEGGTIRQSSLEYILNNPTDKDAEYGYRVQVFSDSGLGSSDPGMTTPPEAWMHGAHDQRTIRVTKNTDQI
ncbi:hypothetical protein DL98DRAFT_585357 [Cadophora sp. DSE1049]|nr:hypothetical protein DL98DRAFT_585357 [Cadophora sp. DSE1049]